MDLGTWSKYAPQTSVLLVLLLVKVSMDVIVVAVHKGGHQRDLACTKLLESMDYTLDTHLEGTLWFINREYRPSRQP